MTGADKERVKTRFAAVVYGAVAYLAFVATLTYLIGFLGNLVVPKGVDDGATGSTALAVVVDLALLGAFAVQHGVIATLVQTSLDPRGPSKR